MLATTLLLALFSFGSSDAAPTASPQDLELRRRIEQLSAESAPERDAAQRWLATNLVPSDFELLAQTARQADAEAVRRVAGALGADARHLELAVKLSAEQVPVLQELGRAAFDELVARWCPDASQRPASRVRVNAQLAKGASRRFLDHARSEPAREAFDRFARLGDISLPVVLSPSAAGLLLELEGLDGDSLQVISSLTRAAGLSYSGIGDWGGEEPGAGAWILVTARGGARAETGLERLRRWCLQVQLGLPEGADAARALAATEWPAALAWLETRWEEQQDPVALEGLLLAAQRGRVSLTLQSSEARSELLRRADAGLAGGEGTGLRSAERIARALAAAPALAMGGVDDSLRAFEDWTQLTPSARWVRLVMLEGRRSGRSDVGRRLLEVVEEELNAPPELRLQALRALATSPSLPLRAVRIDDAPTLARWALTHDRDEELLELFDVLGVDPASCLLEDTDVERAFVAHWSLRRSDPEPAVRALVELASLRDPASDLASPPSGSWVAQLRRWRLMEGRAALRRVVGKALEELEGERRVRLSELALLAGGLDEAGEREAFQRLAELAQPTPLQLELLGALAGGEVRRSATRDLLALLESPPADPLLRAALAPALQRALDELRARRRDPEATELQAEVWRIVWSADHPLHDLLAPPAWPAQGGGVEVRLDLADRVLAGGLR